ncbi:uncharacterized protein EV420DRAFT_1278197 [Desarmillaria tabescens]|uniref:Uncharacterized protein n=1 Tax=Armillaria tabescens TaxID=1929756 RepID=A0AA39JK05_ARMTA|nr:uncharacterized protein EV420DRAFT_1278197 [Desarmillaria tabescens]KAK0442749.1 hypothetical protein EV420DRAFT_1278197 [Desarmillaria tabescens]
MTSAQRHRRASIPPIPDLRFETAYLSKIRPFVHLERVPAPREASDDFETVGDDILYGNEGKQPAREVLEIDWKNVLWVTFRDQVLTMWVQGALWAIVGFYLRPIYTQAGKRFKRKEGGAVSWLRNWVKQLGLSTSTDRAR